MGIQQSPEATNPTIASGGPSPAEMEAAPLNREVGTRLLFENTTVRVWEVRLEPGDRAPLHCHALDYFWTCTEPGTALQWQLKASTWEQHGRSYAVGDTQYFTRGNDAPVIHDLHNNGDTTLRFVTVELLGRTERHTSSSTTPGATP
ncbi:cupin domain-containing protein [Kitasatospora sp. NPDC088346]|uniref:cupin domain-containing protein n=1 Tax=Kitasatospora sp. NPDC088346 TaxID=3364073 RepID=UPI00381FA398